MLVAIKPTRPVKTHYSAPVYVTPERAAQLALEGRATVIPASVTGAFDLVEFQAAGAQSNV